MSVRQRLRAVLDARRVSGICWRCSRGLPRGNYGSGQHDLNKQGEGPLGVNFLVFSGKSYGTLHGSQSVHDTSLDVPHPSGFLEQPGVPVQKAPAPTQESASYRPRFTYHSVTRKPDKAPQSIARSMIGPRIRFHQTDSSIHASRKSHISPTDRALLKQLNGENRETSSESNFGQLNDDAAERKRYPSQWLKQVQAEATSVEYRPPAEGYSMAAQRSFQIIKYPTQANLENSVAKIRKVTESIVRKMRVGNTEHFVYTAQSAGAIHSVRRDSPLEDEPEQTLEEEQALYGELESVLDAFRDLQPTSPPSTNASNSTVSSVESTADETFVKQRPTRGQEDAVLRSIWKQRRSYLDPKSMAQSRHYATASHPHPVDAQVNPFIAGEIPPFDIASGIGIREHLRVWQELQSKQREQHMPAGSPLGSPSKASRNLLTQSGEDDNFTKLTEDTEMDEEEHIDLHPDKDEGITDIFQNQAFLRKGDLVELTAKTEPILAVFVKDLVNQCQFYTMRGEWVNRELSLVKFSVSGFVHPDDLDGILPYLPTDEVAIEKLGRLQPMNINAPRDAGTKILEKMTAFNQAADGVFRRHADRLNRAYDLIAPWHERAGRTFKSLKEIAMTVLQKDAAELTQPMMWAVHRALIDSQNITFDRMNFRQNPIYEILPQQTLSNITRVREWVREFQEDTSSQATAALKTSLDIKTQNPIASFVKKARLAIERSRQTRALSVSGGIGPSSVKIKPVEPQLKTFKEYSSSAFSDKEKIIISYFDAWVTSRYINTMSNLKSLGPMILRAIGKYDGLELNDSLGYTFLQELGVITPWENRTVYKLRGLRLPGHDTVSEETTRLRSKARASLSTFEPIDSMEGLRKDWGDLPVFCIDSAETLERDDGVSLEPIDGTSSEYWVHVHVANPSAYISPKSPSAKYAAQLAESVYFPECKYPMLDPSLSSNYFSLDKDRPCLTFSVRVTTAGELLEKKLTPGRVHNVHYLTPHAVARGLGLNASKNVDNVSLLTVGGEIPAKPKDLNPKTGETLNPSHVGMLRILADLGSATRRGRTPDYYPKGSHNTAFAQVFLSKTVPRPFHVCLQHIRRFEGDPIISIQQETSNLSPISIMVADLMVLAGEIAASWCSERNIPIPYRGLLRNPEPAMPPEDFKRTVIDKAMAANGHVDSFDLLHYGRLLGKTTASATPLEHFALGIPAYCKITSPLRRYVDLYTHWQIEAALRHEAETGTSLVKSDNNDDSYLPFSRQAVEEYASTAIYSQRKVSYARTLAMRHWIVQALHRAFYFGEAPLPETFKILVTGRSYGFATGYMSWLTVKVQLQQTPESTREGGWREGDVWEAKLGFVDPYHVNISMVAVRLLERGGKEYATTDEGI